jgi:hypothetical protein
MQMDMVNSSCHSSNRNREDDAFRREGRGGGVKVNEQ